MVLYAVISSAALLIAVAAFNLKISHACEQFGVSIQSRMGHRLMKGVLEVPYEWHLSKNKAELVRFFHSDISRWGKDCIMRILLLSQNAVGMVVPLILLIAMSPLGGVVGVLVVAAVGYGLMAMVMPVVAVFTEPSLSGSPDR